MYRQSKFCLFFNSSPAYWTLNICYFLLPFGRGVLFSLSLFFISLNIRYFVSSLFAVSFFYFTPATLPNFRPKFDDLWQVTWARLNATTDARLTLFGKFTLSLSSRVMSSLAYFKFHFTCMSPVTLYSYCSCFPCTLVNIIHFMLVSFFPASFFDKLISVTTTSEESNFGSFLHAHISSPFLF